MDEEDEITTVEYTQCVMASPMGSLRNGPGLRGTVNAHVKHTPPRKWPSGLTRVVNLSELEARSCHWGTVYPQVRSSRPVVV